MKTGVNREIMEPIFLLIIGKVLDFIADNAPAIIEEIKNQFPKAMEDPEVATAAREFTYDPNKEGLTRLSDALKEKGEDPEKLASLLVSKTIV